MNDELTVAEQREVSFYDDVLIAVRDQDGQIYVSLPSMCDSLGIQTSAQTKRIKRHDVLIGGYQVLSLTYSSKMDEQPIQRRQSGVLRVDLVPLWLTSLSVKSIKPEMQPKIKRYQQEAAKVLWEAFQEGRLTADPDFDFLLKSDSEAVQAYKMLQAMVKLARNQVLLESRLDAHEQKLETQHQRLEAIETELGSGRTITPDQATAISQAVKAVAMVMSKMTLRNEYGSVYGELYRRYRVPSYRELPAAKYDDAIKWLGEWLESLTGDEVF